jgi:hypothetical protein
MQCCIPRPLRPHAAHPPGAWGDRVLDRRPRPLHPASARRASHTRPSLPLSAHHPLAATLLRVCTSTSTRHHRQGATPSRGLQLPVSAYSESYSSAAPAAASSHHQGAADDGSGFDQGSGPGDVELSSGGGRGPGRRSQPPLPVPEGAAGAGGAQAASASAAGGGGGIDDMLGV